MTEIEAKVRDRSELAVTVIRADGRRVELGIISGAVWWRRHGPFLWAANRRIRKANRMVES